MGSPSAAGPRQVRIRRVHDQAVLPQPGTSLAAGFDLHTIADAAVAWEKPSLLRTGLVIEAPPGHMLVLALRSSAPKKFGVMMPHGVGIVDGDYCGEEDEILLQVQATQFAAHIPAGTRLAQGMFVPVFTAFDWDEHRTPWAPSRGGFGSTG